MIKIPKKLKPWLMISTAILGGALCPLAFSPFDMRIFAFASPIILLSLLSKKTVKQAFFRGYLFGLGLFAVGSSWIYVSIHEHGHTNVFLAFTITTLFILILAIFYGALAATLNALSPKENLSRTVLVFPALWVAFEMLRGFLFTGFPWLYLGYSQLNTHLSHYAPLGSVWAVSLAVALIAGISYYFLYLLYTQQKGKALKISLSLLFLAIWAGGYFLNKITYTTPMGPDIEVALVQGNVPQYLRWDPYAVEQIKDTYETLTVQNLDASLIVWPESAIPIALPYANPLYEAFGELAQKNNTAMIAGVPEKVAGKEAYYNGILGFGLAKGFYRKTHLVPFGEYVPFENLLRGLIGFFDLPMSRFIPSKAPQPPIEAFGYQFGPAICYEIAYPRIVQKMANQSDVLLTISNDTWFGRSIGPWQHLQIAQFRALETGRYLLRATNTGLTAIINPEGDITHIAPQFTRTVLRGTIQPMEGQTPWMKWGIWPLLLLLGLMIAASTTRKPR